MSTSSQPLAHNPIVAESRSLQETNERGEARGLRVRHHPAAVPEARKAVLVDIGDTVDDTTRHEAEIVISELLGNAIRHALPIDKAIHLKWQVRGETVDIEVTDGGPRFPERDRGIRPLRPTPVHTHGRGLRIVRSVSHEWGVQEDDNGCRTVWAAVGGPSKRRRREP